MVALIEETRDTPCMAGVPTMKASAPARPALWSRWLVVAEVEKWKSYRKRVAAGGEKKTIVLLPPLLLL